jgi:hypothetical protein
MQLKLTLPPIAPPAAPGQKPAGGPRTAANADRAGKGLEPGQPCSTALRSWDDRLCDHLRHEVRQRIDAAGRPFYQHQCLDCGARLGTAVAAAKALADGRQPAPFDEDLFQEGDRKLARHFDEQRAALNRAIDERWAGRRLAYEAYLLSEAWRNKRAEALRRDEGVCQGCRARPATQVHHLTYAHLGDELLFELISVCADCHERIHRDRLQAWPGAAI